MSSIIKKMSNKDLGVLDRYLDDADAGVENAITIEITKDPEFSELVEKFSYIRGKLQYFFGDISLSQKQQEELLALAENPEDMAIREATRMEFIKRKELTETVFKASSLLVAVLLVLTGFFYFNKSRYQDDFRPLEYLGWETEAFEYDAEGRLDFPLPSVEEIKNYLKNYKRLGFNPVVVEPKSSNIKAKGATVIDYEPRKVSVVVYTDRGKSDDIIALFSFRGRMSDLPKAQVGNLSGLIYQTYSSDKYNIVAFEPDETTLAFVVGRHSAEELAEFVRR